MGIDNDEVIQRAFADNRILITNDKDFGEKVYREQPPHKGVILLRLADERPAIKIGVLERLLSAYADRIPGQFGVVAETKIRFARTSPATYMQLRPRGTSESTQRADPWHIFRSD
jgi:hypothetical protein